MATRFNVADPNPMRPEPSFEDPLAALQTLGESIELDEAEEPVLNDDGSMTYFEAEFSEVAEPLDPEDHFANLLADSGLKDWADEKAMSLIETIEDDIKARKPRDELYAEGIKRAGVGEDAPGGANFTGASRVTHPMLVQAGVEFQADMSRELLPAGGPVRFVPVDGQMDTERDLAERKARHMNLQLTTDMPEFYPEMEQMLSQVPFGGTQYIKAWWNKEQNRPEVQFVPLDKFILAAEASSYITASRATHILDYTEDEFWEKVESGEFIDDDGVSPATERPEETDAEKASDKVEGVDRDDENRDQVRRFYEVSLKLTLPDDDMPKPYLLVMDKDGKAVSLRRNWAPGDSEYRKIFWIVDFNMIPWRGPIALGLMNIIGSLSIAATGALRSLLDAGLATTVPTGLTLKGARLTGQDKTMQIGEINQVSGPNGTATPGMKINDLISTVNFPQPSPVLFQLLGFLTQQGTLTANISTEKMQEARNTGPVGTTLALIEQGSRVYRSVHSRMHRSMANLLSLLHWMNGVWLDGGRLAEKYPDLGVASEDYQGKMELIPVSDPNIFSDTQRIAQAQAVQGVFQMFPQLLNPISTVRFLLDAMKIPNGEQLLNLPEDPSEMDPLQENLHVSMVKVPRPGDRPPAPLQAYEHQDHMGHVLTHISFLTNPVLGMSPMLMPVAGPALIPHIQQHIVLAYKQLMEQGVEYIRPQMPGAQIGQIMAQVSQLVGQQIMQAFQQIAQTLGQLQQQVTQMTQQQSIPPEMQAQMIMAQAAMMDAQSKMQKVQIEGQMGQMETQAKMQDSQVKSQIALQKAQSDQIKTQADMQFKQADLQLKAQAEQNDLQLGLMALKKDEGEALIKMQETASKLQAQAEELRQSMLDLTMNTKIKAAEMVQKERINTADNETAVQIARMNERARSVKNGNSFDRVGDK